MHAQAVCASMYEADAMQMGMVSFGEQLRLVL